MKTLLWHDRAIREVDIYIERYSDYFFDLYTDTGIFSEDLILENYEEEAKKRKQEIKERISERLTPDIVQGRTLDNTLYLSWRSKILWVAWEDDGDTRIVIDMQIR